MGLDWRAAAIMRRRSRMLTATALGVAVALFGLVVSPADRLIWNRTGSAPIGLYWLSDAPFTHGRWVVVSSQSDDAQWAQRHGFVGRDWPLIKQVAGLPGDQICRRETQILINGKRVGEAQTEATSGRPLPSWQGCICLGQDQIFLMNTHPRSLDGRYFGPANQADLVGTARLILKWGE
jgi:conjugative transfer signal peptidase TraF